MTSRMLAGGLSILVGIGSTAPPPAGAEQRIANVSQGTDMALALTPEGDTLVIDLLGRLWQLPASGGGALPLTPEDEAARHPRVGPNRLVVYQRRIGQQWDLWLLELDTGERRPLVASEYDEREPDFSADGESVVFVSDRTGHDCLWSVSVADGVLTQLTEEPGDASFPSVSERGEIAYIRRQGEAWALRVLTPQGVPVEMLSRPHRLAAPTWRPGGGVLVYNEITRATGATPARSELNMLVLSSDRVIKTLTRAEDVFAARAAWAAPGEYYYTADGQIWRRGIAHASREPVHLFAAVTVDALSPPPLTEPLDAPGPNRAFGITGLSRSADGKVAVFTALGDLWLADGRATPRRLTDDAFVDVDASVSAAGDFAIFASDRSGYMDLWRITLPGGVVTQLTNRPEKAFRPAIAPDDQRVAFLETTGLDDAGPARLHVLDLRTRKITRTFPDGLLAPDALRWRDAGTLALNVRADAGTSRDVALTIDLASGAREAAPLSQTDTTPATASGVGDELTWVAPPGQPPYVVQAGRLFDGVRSDYRRHVDIHVEGERITAIVGRGLLPLPEIVIDARDATVIPGLIDVHAHQSNLLGERLGRAWLAHGVTTVRELADDVPAALERAEAWASGRRPGPRLVVSPVGAAATTTNLSASLPVPVRAYTTLRSAPLLFSSDAVSHTWPLREHPDAGPAGTILRVSPLQLTYEDVFSTVVQSGSFVTTNMASIASADSVGKTWRRLSTHDTAARLYMATERAAWPDARSARSAAQTAALKSNIARLVRAGGQVAAGAEAPVVPYGLGLHLELALLAEAGIPLDQVLRIATASNALALGLEGQLGTLEEGKLADFVVVNGDPLRTLTDAMNVEATVTRGRWQGRTALVGAP